MPYRSIHTTLIPEASTAALSLQLTDEGGEALDRDRIASLTLTLYDEDSEAVINEREDQSILNANGGSVDASGLLTLTLDPADNPILATGKEQERHVALLTWEWGADGATPEATPVVGTNHAEIVLRVGDLGLVGGATP